MYDVAAPARVADWKWSGIIIVVCSEGEGVHVKYIKKKKYYKNLHEIYLKLLKTIVLFIIK